MAEQIYTYAISTDFPGGAINSDKLVDEIAASAIITALERIDTADGSVDVVFKAALSSGDKTLLDNDVTTGNLMGGLIGAHDNSPTTPSVESVNIDNSPEVHVRKPDGMTHGRVYGFSVNFCDKTTWYHNATEVVDEAIDTGDGATTVFALDHGDTPVSGERIVDASHGKMSEENNIANGNGDFREMGNGYGATFAATLSGYVPIIKVDGVEKTERTYGGPTDGDYEIDYVTGALTFFIAPANTLDITATYWYVGVTDVACTLVVPSAGKKYQIDRVEIQSTPDACPMTDIVMNVYGGAAPPNGFPLARPTVIKNVTDIVNWAYGASPQIPIQGGANDRALTSAVNIHQVRYASSIPLLSSQLMYMQVHLGESIEFDGTWATIVIYGIEEAE